MKKTEAILREKEQEARRIEEVRRKIQNGEQSPNVCDKCCRPVPLSNNAAALAFYLGQIGPIEMMFATPRHLLPVVENGNVVCEGSPSRAQYLPGQPRDKRMSYAYRPDSEATYRAAYQVLQHEAAAQNAELN